MDVDLMKSSSSSSGEDEQIDMMQMMMQMEKLPDFCDPNLNQEFHFSTSNNNTTTYNLSSSSSSSLSLPFMPTTTALIQEPTTIPNTKFKNPLIAPFSNANSFLTSMEKKNSTAAIREMIFRIAAMQPIHIDPESVKPPKRRNVKISKDPQSVAARHRRERISERIRILQRLVPGGTKMDTASMLDEAIHYVKFLKKQVQSLEQAGANRPTMAGIAFPFSAGLSTLPNNNSLGYSSLVKNCSQLNPGMVSSMQMLR